MIVCSCLFVNVVSLCHAGAGEEGGSDSSSEEDESDDPDTNPSDDFAQAFLMTGSKKDRGKSPVPRSTTPTTDDKKRKHQSSPRSGSPSVKKIKQEPTNVSDIKPDIKPVEARPSTPSTSSGPSSSR